MKIRTGFVSNSSSSSFVCDVTGAKGSGWDASASDCGMIVCKRGHVFLERLLIDAAEMTRKEMLAEIRSQEKKYQESIDDYMLQFEEMDDGELRDEYDENYCDGVRAVNCPICSFVELHRADALEYLLRSRNVSREELLAELKTRFKNYSELKAFLKDKSRLSR